MSSPRRFLPAVLLVAALPSTTLAQATADLGGEIFWAHTTSLPGSPGMGGLGLTMSSSGVGLRASAAFSQRYDDLGDALDMPWTADADLFINSAALGQVIGIAMGGFMPVGFVGVGRQGVREPGGSMSSVTTFSYGAGASVPLFAGLRLAAELRQRRAISAMTDYMATGMGTGREIRLGLTFGGRGEARRGRTSAGGRRGDVVLGGGRSSTVASASARRVISTGEQYLGVPYVYGGEDPSTGLDCSAFTQLVYRRNGVQLPRTSRQQAVVGREVLMDFGVVRPGDLLFFASNGSRVDHVAIYVGGDRVLHATSSGGEVRYDDLRSQRGEWFVNHLVGARRVLDEAGGEAFVRSLNEALRIPEVLDFGDSAPKPRR